MKETTKTLIFLAVAAVVWGLVIVTRPSLLTSEPEDVINQLLYPEFTDPLAVTNLEIVEFDEQRGAVHALQVAQVETRGKIRWAIPSHDNYPADAKDQVASAAAGLMGLKILKVASENMRDQSEYGVVEPDPKALKVGDTGVGMRVVMKDKAGKDLLALVIGKEAPGRTGLRYVRKVGQPSIYEVEAKTDKLSTRFEDWIERNLLGLSGLDLKQLWVRDYSVDQMRRALVQRGETVLEYSDTGEPKWKLMEERKFTVNKEKRGDGQWVSVKPSADEELNATKLDELRTALGDLKIVDVSRKPAGLSADLKAAADFSGKEDAFVSLAEKGFYLTALRENGPVELVSNEGELRVTMKDGVEYVLRFGDIAGAGDTKKKDKKKDKSADGDQDTDKKGSGMNRYLFVMAEFNPNMIAKPKFDPLPAAKKDADKDKKPADKKPDAKKPDEKKADDKKSGDKKPDDKKAQDSERERVEKENKRKQEEYDQKIADGKKRVEELNARFADWYYVIPDEDFRKVHLGRDEIFKKKEKPKDQAKDKKGEHAGHNHGAAEEATPAEKLDKLQGEGPGGK